MKMDTSPEALAEELLGRPFDELEEDDQRALCRVMSHDVSLDPDEEELLNATRGDRLADAVARVGGSWGFICFFVAFMAIWMALNVLQLFGVHFDPYPFILLNLSLSTLAALQAPVIMMSQNRQSKKDRISNRHDYEINLRTTVEILLLHRKIDKVFNKIGQMERTVEEVGETTEGAIRQAIEPGESQRSAVS